MKITLFVYGTLMRGEAAAHLLSGAQLLGEARTAARYELLQVGAYPALARDGTTCIAGELYAVEAKTLAELDAYEGSAYERHIIELADGGKAQAYVVRETNASWPVIESGRWRARPPPR